MRANQIKFIVLRMTTEELETGTAEVPTQKNARIRNATETHPARNVDLPKTRIGGETQKTVKNIDGIQKTSIDLNNTVGNIQRKDYPRKGRRLSRMRIALTESCVSWRH